MPKFKSEESRQAFCEQYAAVKEWRTDVVCDLIRKVMPTGSEKAIPKNGVARVAVDYYEKHADEIRDGDAMFDAHKDSFICIRYILNHWSDVTGRLSDMGVTVCYCHKGQFISGKRADIEAVFTHRDTIIRKTTERRNLLAENANRKRYIALPMLTLDLYLPAVSVAA